MWTRPCVSCTTVCRRTRRWSRRMCSQPLSTVRAGTWRRRRTTCSRRSHRISRSERTRCSCSWSQKLRSSHRTGPMHSRHSNMHMNFPGLKTVQCRLGKNIHCRLDKRRELEYFWTWWTYSVRWKISMQPKESCHVLWVNFQTPQRKWEWCWHRQTWPWKWVTPKKL